MRKRSITIAAVAVAVAGMAGAGAASAAPPALPDASLFCLDEEIVQGDWDINPNSGTLWITAGDLGGHYVILDSAHYYAEGDLYDVPDYDALLFLDSRVIGKKTGILDSAIQCDFISRWGDFSIVGPMTISRVSD